MKCSICNIYPAVHETPEIEEYICELCEIRKKVYVDSSQNWKKFKPFLDGKLDKLDY